MDIGTQGLGKNFETGGECGKYGKYGKNEKKRVALIFAAAYMAISAAFAVCSMGAVGMAEKQIKSQKTAILSEMSKSAGGQRHIMTAGLPEKKELADSAADGLQTESQIQPQTQTEINIQSGASEKDGNESGKVTEIAGFSHIMLYDGTSGKLREYPLEEYVAGAVLCEMPSSFGEQALRAQAIACRTYAVYNIMGGRQHGGAVSLCTNPAHCQAFRIPQSGASGVSEQQLLAVKAAVQSTAGEIMLYGGKPILAAFHASAGKKTKSSAEVWGGELAYLVSVDAYEDQSDSVQTDKSYVFAISEFASALRGCGELLAFSDDMLAADIKTDKSPSGKVRGLWVCGVYIDGDKAVSALGLRSSDFDISCDGANVTVTCHGYGHGVGLSQYGAREMASMGYDCHEILSHYYSGITFGRVGGE